MEEEKAEEARLKEEAEERGEEPGEGGLRPLIRGLGHHLVEYRSEEGEREGWRAAGAEPQERRATCGPSGGGESSWCRSAAAKPVAARNS